MFNYVYMIAENIQYLSQEKIDALNAELKTLKVETIPKLARRIDEARQLGDLSENAEYHTAREEMAWAQSRVKEIQAILQNAELISTNLANSDVVQVGSSLTVEIGDSKRDFTIVGAQEADPLSGKISNESPLGSAFLGKRCGDSVEIDVPAGKQVYKIVSIG